MKTLEQDCVIALDNVTRIEVIDETGRILIKYDQSEVSISLQDGTRTLKIFTKSVVKS